MEITEINEQSLNEALPGNALIEFFSPTCVYCKRSEPLLRRLSDEYTDIGFFKLDISKNESMADRYRINGLPTFVLMSNGAEIGRSVGAKGESVIRDLLDQAK